ncbi:hypothetical protein CRM22_011346, partial [Opisthorchis felineus]
MKLTVCFGDTKVVVPCGSGELTIRDLAFSALKRVRHTLPKLDIHERVVVHSVTIARDGGILDWDDLVRDVLDDRELVTAHYSIATLANSTTTTLTSVTAEKDPTLPLNSTDQLFRHLCTPLVVDLCSDSGAGGSYHSGPQSNEASGSGESATGFPRLTSTSRLVRAVAVASPAACREPGNTLSASAVAEDSNLNGSSRSSSSLSLNMSSGSCNGHHTHSSSTWKQQEQSKTDGEVPVCKNSLPIPDNRGHLTCPHFGSYPSRTTELDRIFRVANHSVTDATFWEPLRPSEASATLPSSVGRNSSTPENSGVWHQAFSPTTFATLASVLCRRRDCIEMNWDTDEDEDEEEESRAGDIMRPNENRANINLINSDDHARVTASEAVSRPLSEIWNGKQTTHPIVVHKNDSSVSRIQTYMSPIPPSNVSLLQSVVPEVPSPKLWPLPPEPVVDELSGSDTLQGREKPQDRQSVVGCQTDFVDHLRATKLQLSSVGDRSLPQPSYIHSK